MFSLKYHTIFYYIFIILMYNQNFSFGQYSDTKVENDKQNNKILITSELVEKIVQKVCNITVETLARSDSQDKERLVSKIEDKLYKSAIQFPHGEAYVRMLMKGVRLMAYKNSRKNTKVVPSNTGNKSNLNLREKSKPELIKNIAKKIETIASAFAKSKAIDDHKKAIQEIKKILDLTASKKHKELHNQHQQVKSYSDLLSKGIEEAMGKLSRTRKEDSLDTLEIDIVNNNAEKTLEDNSNDISVVNGQELERRANKPNRLKPNSLLNDEKDIDCTEIRIHLCNNINALNVLQCPSDNTRLDISKLCNGVVDCSDNSDERDCTEKVKHVVHNATTLVMQIESSMTLHCYPNTVEDEIMSQQSELLRKVLDIQLKFIEKHSNVNSVDMKTSSENSYKLRRTMNELVTVIDTLTLALKTTLCIPPKNYRKSNDEEEIMNNEINIEEKLKEVEETIEEAPARKPGRTLDKCVCLAGNCNGSSCSQDCVIFCQQRYTLGRWKCEAVGGGQSVATDIICDGKLDCVDESDEDGCVDGFAYAKFEAQNIFKKIQGLILTKIKSEPNESIRNKMISLSNFLKSLLAKLIDKKKEIMEIKHIREDAFTALVEILEESGKGKTLNETTSLFNELMTWNVQLVKALMRTHTGNEKLVSSDGCLCAGNKCVQSNCSKLCIRACSSEMLLTRYYCGDSTRYEDSVPISSICNGTAECQGKDDESDCQKEGCRLHHLMVLRHKIAKATINDRGTALGEAIRAWKTKVNTSMKLVEKDRSRPTLKTIRRIIKNMLRDLVMTYAGLEAKRRGNPDHVLNEFVKISRILFESLRVCGY